MHAEAQVAHVFCTGFGRELVHGRVHFIEYGLYMAGYQWILWVDLERRFTAPFQLECGLLT